MPFFVGHNGEYYRLITSGFLHANLLHIAPNMLSLVFVGPALERMIGPLALPAVYLLSLLGGSAAVYAFGSIGLPVVGASGALFGLFGACLVLVRRLGLDLQWLIGIIVLNFVVHVLGARASRSSATSVASSPARWPGSRSAACRLCGKRLPTRVQAGRAGRAARRAAGDRPAPHGSPASF